MYSIRIMKKRYKKAKSGQLSSAAHEAADPGPRRWIIDLCGLLTAYFPHVCTAGGLSFFLRGTAEKISSIPLHSFRRLRTEPVFSAGTLLRC